MDRAAAPSAANRAAPKGRRAADLVLALPNILTYLRILAVPAVVACLYFLPHPTARWSALVVYLFACITDWFDGYLARVWQQQSALGQMLDPIADKLLVGATLLLLTHDNTINGVHIWAAVIILCREILVSGLREFLATLNVKIRVSQLAKWKTTLQMVALGVLLTGAAGDALFRWTSTIGLGLLWVAALLTLATGWDYLRAAIREAMTD
jgi:cardiolipin synthase (CMP-forming)